MSNVLLLFISPCPTPSHKLVHSATPPPTHRSSLPHTHQVIVPDKLLALRDSLAEHIHDVWSREKVKSGWRFAEVRNNTAKEHPCLKPYSDLSEEEKRYDFNLAFETLA